MRFWLLLAAMPSILPAQELKFEVASIKLRPQGTLITMIGGGPSGPRLTLEAMSLVDLVSWAYNVKPWQVAGGPPWAGVQKERSRLDESTRRFDIAAKAEGEKARSPEEFRQMLQSLLTERFHVALRRESRETPVYALTVDKNGSKLRESPPEAKGILRMNGGGRVVGSGATITQLAGWFSNANGVDRPIVDETGLAGRYDFTLEWSNPMVGTPSDAAPSIFTAMPEQLGLRLVPKRAPLEFLVVDRAEMPTEN
jgi:uncharacterized protein (TIGR03435 family)